MPVSHSLQKVRPGHRDILKHLRRLRPEEMSLLRATPHSLDLLGVGTGIAQLKDVLCQVSDNVVGSLKREKTVGARDRGTGRVERGHVFPDSGHPVTQVRRDQTAESVCSFGDVAAVVIAKTLNLRAGTGEVHPDLEVTVGISLLPGAVGFGAWHGADRVLQPNQGFVVLIPVRSALLVGVEGFKEGGKPFEDHPVEPAQPLHYPQISLVTQLRQGIDSRGEPASLVVAVPVLPHRLEVALTMQIPQFTQSLHGWRTVGLLYSVGMIYLQCPLTTEHELSEETLGGSFVSLQHAGAEVDVHGHGTGGLSKGAKHLSQGQLHTDVGSDGDRHMLQGCHRAAQHLLEGAWGMVVEDVATSVVASGSGAWVSFLLSQLWGAHHPVDQGTNPPSTADQNPAAGAIGVEAHQLVEALPPTRCAQGSVHGQHRAGSGLPGAGSPEVLVETDGRTAQSHPSPMGEELRWQLTGVERAQRLAALLAGGALVGVVQTQVDGSAFHRRIGLGSGAPLHQPEHLLHRPSLSQGFLHQLRFRHPQHDVQRRVPPRTGGEVAGSQVQVLLGDQTLGVNQQRVIRPWGEDRDPAAAEATQADGERSEVEADIRQLAVGVAGVDGDIDATMGGSLESAQHQLIRDAGSREQHIRARTSSVEGLHHRPSGIPVEQKVPLRLHHPTGQVAGQGA